MNSPKFFTPTTTSSKRPCLLEAANRLIVGDTEISVVVDLTIKMALEVVQYGLTEGIRGGNTSNHNWPSRREVQAIDPELYAAVSCDMKLLMVAQRARLVVAV